MSRHNIATMLIVGASLLLSCAWMGRSDSGAGIAAPVETIEGTSKSGTLNCGWTDNGLFEADYVTVDDLLLKAWNWDDGTLKMVASVRTSFMLPLCTRVTSDGRFIALARFDGYDGPGPYTVALASTASGTASGSVIRTLPYPPGRWHCLRTGLSRNGKFAAVAITMDLPQLISDHKSKDYRNGFRVGVLDLSSLELRWVDLHVDEIKGMGGTDIHQLAISNDGRYIAAGCHVSDVMIDTVEQKVLWNGNSTKPFACLSLPVFSSDGSKVYVGDAISSNVVLLDTRTGDSIKQWHATETGRVIRGRSLACIAVSPDDNWVAVGAQMRGEVYLINTHSDGPPVVLQQKGGPRALSFSPDSKRLACMAGDVISIWEVPAGGPSAAPPKQAPAAGAKEASP